MLGDLTEAEYNNLDHSGQVEDSDTDPPAILEIVEPAPLVRGRRQRHMTSRFRESILQAQGGKSM